MTIIYPEDVQKEYCWEIKARGFDPEDLSLLSLLLFMRTDGYINGYDDHREEMEDYT